MWFLQNIVNDLNALWEKKARKNEQRRKRRTQKKYDIINL